MVGSADFNDALIGGQINFATAPSSRVRRSSRSSTPPPSRGLEPRHVVMDVPYEWDVAGQDPTSRRTTPATSTARSPSATALSNSLNIPAVKATEYAGVQG